MHPLRPRPPEEIPPLQDERLCVGGLRDTWHVLDRIPGHVAVGTAVSGIIGEFLDRHPAMQSETLARLGSKNPASQAWTAGLDTLRSNVARCIGAMLREEVDDKPINTPLYTTCVRGHLLNALGS